MLTLATDVHLGPTVIESNTTSPLDHHHDDTPALLDGTAVPPQLDTQDTQEPNPTPSKNAQPGVDMTISQHDDPAKRTDSKTDTTLPITSPVPDIEMALASQDTPSTNETSTDDHQAQPAHEERAEVDSEPFPDAGQLGVDWLVTNVHFGLPLFNLDVSTMVGDRLSLTHSAVLYM